MVDAFFPKSKVEVPLRCRLWILSFVGERDLGALRVASKVWNEFGGEYGREEWAALREGGQVRDITVPLLRLGRVVNVDCGKLTGLKALGERVKGKMVSVTLRNLRARVSVQEVCRFLAGLGGVETVVIDGYPLLTEERVGLVARYIPKGVKQICFCGCPGEGMLVVSPGATDERVIALAEGLKLSKRRVEVVDLRNCFELTDECAGALCRAVSQARVVRLGGCAGFSVDGMRDIFDDLSPGIESIDVSGCSGFTDAVAIGVAMQLSQTLQRLDVRHCEILTNKGLTALVKALPKGFSELAVRGNRFGDEKLAVILGMLEGSGIGKITIAGEVGAQVTEVLSKLGLRLGQAGVEESVYECDQEEKNPGQREPNSPHSASNSPPRNGLKPSLILVEEEADLIELAEKGDLKAQLALGKLYRAKVRKAKGREEREKARAAAIKWLRQPAKAGILEGQYLLACCLEGSSEDDAAEWATWLHRAANGGYREAQFELANSYRFGNQKGVPKNLQLRFKYLLMAARLNHAEAQHEVSSCYSWGEGTGECEKLANYWLEQAAVNGCSGAQWSLGRSLLTGSGLKRNPVKAVRCFEDAAGLGDRLAKIDLGRCLRDGVGTGKNPERAVQLFKEVISVSETPPYTFLSYSARAKLELAKCLAKGIGIGKNIDEAKEMLETMYADKRLRGKKAHGDVMIYLGTCFETGLLGEQDYTKAVALYREARQNQNCYAKAAARLGMCYFYGRGVPVDRKKAYDLFKDEYCHDQDAAYHAGLCFEKGWGVAKSKMFAKMRYEWVISESRNHGKSGHRVGEAQAGLKRLDECVIL